MSERITAAALKQMLLDDDELALLDVREEAIFGQAHLLYACPLPLSRLELRFADLVPRRSRQATSFLPVRRPELGVSSVETVSRVISIMSASSLC